MKNLNSQISNGNSSLDIIFRLYNRIKEFLNVIFGLYNKIKESLKANEDTSKKLREYKDAHDMIESLEGNVKDFKFLYKLSKKLRLLSLSTFFIILIALTFFVFANRGPSQDISIALCLGVSCVPLLVGIMSSIVDWAMRRYEFYVYNQDYRSYLRVIRLCKDKSNKIFIESRDKLTQVTSQFRALSEEVGKFRYPYLLEGFMASKKAGSYASFFIMACFLLPSISLITLTYILT